MNRCLKLSVLTALTLASSQALALDLGQIQVKSALDRPLVAEIPLHPDHPGEADQVQVSLAPASAFAQAGVSRADLKVPLSFTVVTHADGQKFIRVTSTQPVREPYLDFLIQVTWPQGKMLREYTVLLDPLSAGSTPAAATPATTNTHAVQTQAPAPQSAAPKATSSSEQTTPSSDSYGPVPHGDTLSHIARANAIDGVSYQQMLVALKTANPDAFFKDNVNALKAGAVLRIPTRQEAQAVTRRAAIAAVRKQNQAWQALHDTAPTMVAGSGGSSSPVVGSGSGAGGGDHLSLVPPEAGGSASASAAGDASASQLRQELARSQEALSSQKQSAADLKSRMTALEQLQDKNKRLLSLKNAEISELQDKLADARKTAGLPALPASVAQADMATAASAANGAVASAGSVAGASPAVATSTMGAAVAASAASATATPAAAAQTRAIKPQPTVTPTQNKASEPWYKQLWARIALGVVIVLLLIWAFLRRRKPGSKQGRSALAEHFSDSPLGPEAATVALDDDDETLHAPLVDDDGEHELLAQLAEHPDDVGLHLELASLYYARRDVDQFEAAAEAMHAYVDDESQPEWQDVLAMGRDLAPDHPLFAASAVASGDDDDIGEDWQAGSQTPSPVDDAGQPESSGYSYDFDLMSGSAIDADADKSDDAPSHAAETSDVETGGMPDESEFDALPPLASEPDDTMTHDEQAFEMPESTPESQAQGLAHELSMGDAAEDFAQDGEGFSDDPVDTKLDLARAYIDMGDHEGAKAMLQEAIHEGSQTQKESAQKLLDELG